VRSSELGETRRDVLHRFDRLTADLELDRERARWWAIGQTLAWSVFDGSFIDWHLQVVRTLLERA
jgi:streptomycin 6-kinase